MTYEEHVIARQQAVQTAMAALVQDTRFADFIVILRQNREAAIDNLTDKNVVSNERATLACIGEITTYGDIIRIYEDARARGGE